MSRPDAPVAALSLCRPVGILSVEHAACLALAVRLAGRADVRPAGRGNAAACGRPADRPRGLTVLPQSAFRPDRPFSGPLFAVIEALALAAHLAVADPHASGVSDLSDGRPDAEGPAATRSAGPPLPPCLGLIVPVVWLGRGEEAAEPTVVRGATVSSAAASSAAGSVVASSAAAGRPFVITDHVDLTGRGPLAGPWPAGRPRTFPAMDAVYAPDTAAALLARAEAESAAGECRPGGGHTPAGECEPGGGHTAAGREPGSTPAAGECEPDDGRSARGPAIYSRLAVAGVADICRQTSFEREQARAAGLSVAASCLVAPVVIAAYYGLVVAAVGVPAVQ